MSRHHRRLLRRLRTEWAVPKYPPRLFRGWGGQWCISMGAFLFAHDPRRVRALQLALKANRAAVAEAARRGAR